MVAGPADPPHQRDAARGEGPRHRSARPRASGGIVEIVSTRRSRSIVTRRPLHAGCPDGTVTNRLPRGWSGEPSSSRAQSSSCSVPRVAARPPSGRLARGSCGSWAGWSSSGSAALSASAQSRGRSTHTATRTGGRRSTCSSSSRRRSPAGLALGRAALRRRPAFGRSRQGLRRAGLRSRRRRGRHGRSTSARASCDRLDRGRATRRLVSRAASLEVPLVEGQGARPVRRSARGLVRDRLRPTD